VSEASPLERVIAFYETLAPGRLDEIDRLYAANACFRDPFNEVRGAASIRRIFERMFDDIDDARFQILDTIEDRRGAFLTWDFTFRTRRRRGAMLLAIHGASHLRFDHDGRVAYHRDYWDAAGELYEKLPWVGALVRALRKRIGGDATPPRF
jgi:steroid delta-isomerase